MTRICHVILCNFLLIKMWIMKSVIFWKLSEIQILVWKGMIKIRAIWLSLFSRLNLREKKRKKHIRHFWKMCIWGAKFLASRGHCFRLSDQSSPRTPSCRPRSFWGQNSMKLRLTSSFIVRTSPTITCREFSKASRLICLHLFIVCSWLIGRNSIGIVSQMVVKSAKASSY